MKILRLALLLFFMPLATTVAEYRAFELLIKNERTGEERVIASTLDHIQYPQYYPLQAGETVEYMDSWMCWHNGSYYEPTCPKPEVKVTEQKPKTTP